MSAARVSNAPTELRTRRLSLALLALIVSVVWSGVARNGFIPLDDPQYVTENVHVRDGFAPGSLAWAWTSGAEANWHPLTWMSHMLDCALFGLDAGAQHLVALGLHVVSMLLLATLLFRWTQAWWPSLFVAAVFGLHPLHVESVAWVAERKDVLSNVFFVLTLHAWTSWIAAPRPWRYALALALFALGLTAKPMLVTLPALLLVLDFWPFARFATRSKSALVLEKLPFLALAAVSSWVTFLVQRAGGAVVEGERLSLAGRVANALVAYARYALKLFWPADLSVMYPHRDWSALLVAGCALALVSALIWAWIGRKERPWRITGLLWFLGTLVPVIGLVQVGFQSMANRYTYVPLTGLVMVLVLELAPSALSGARARVLAGAALVALALCAWRTRVEVARWHDGVALFSHAVTIDEDNHVARRLLARSLAEQGRNAEAEAELARAASVPRAQADALVKLAAAAGAQNRWDEAARLLSQAARLTPRHVEAHLQLALALLRLQRDDEARGELERVLELEPAHVQAHGQLGRLALARQDFDAALRHFRAAHEALPGETRITGTLALALLEAGRAEEALEQFGALLRAAPNESRASLAHAIERARASGDAQRALQLEQLSAREFPAAH